MNRLILLVVAILFATVLFHFLPSSQAQNIADIIVNPGDSIQQAINEANENDTIYISSGTYFEQRIIVNKTVTLVGANAETTIVDGEGTDAAIFTIRANGVKIKNLTVQNTSPIAGYGISSDSFKDITISDCIIKQCFQAVRLANCTNFTLTRNVIKDNYSYGIYLHDYSSYNYIVGNDIINNTIGVCMFVGVEKNMLYHNNLIDNTHQLGGLGLVANYWSEAYPIGGNFWSTYTGVDFYSGPYQNETGNDGIGDEKYTIYGEVADFYPLMAPIHFFNAGTWNEQEYHVAIATKSNVSDFNFYTNETLPYLSFNLSNSATFCRVTVPKQLLSVDYPENWMVLVDNNPPDFLNIIEDDNYTYFYFNFTLDETTGTIRIIGTDAIPEFPQLILVITFIATTVTLIIVKKKGLTETCRLTKNPQFST